MKVIPIFDIINDFFDIKIKDKNFKIIVNKAKEILKKYYCLTTKYHEIATILDPRLKLKYYEVKEYEKSKIDEIKKKYLLTLF